MQVRIGPAPTGCKPVEPYLTGVVVNMATAGEAIFHGDLLTIVDGVATRGVKHINAEAFVAAEFAEKGVRFTYYQPGMLNG